MNSQAKSAMSPTVPKPFQLLLLCIVPALLVYGCAQRTEREKILLGTWAALWETTPAGMTGIPADGLTMQGRITFHNDGTVTIEAYGHQNCIFAQDTLNNRLRWELEENTLRFIDEEDETGLPYAVENIGEDTVRLVLVEDIFLTLSR